MNIVRKVILCLVFMSSVTTAATVSVDGLSDKQIADMKAAIAQQAASNVQTGSVATITDASPAELAKWGEQLSVASEGIARALGIAAREVGTSVNEFMSTPAGKVTLLVILWKVFGALILKIVVVFIIIPVALYTASRMRNMVYFNGYEVIKKSVLFGYREVDVRVPVYKKADSLDSDEYWLLFWSIILVAAALTASAIILLNAA